LERYQHVENVLRLHRDDPNDGRHHAFDIDVLTLLKQPFFIERYQQKLKDLKQNPDLIVTPDHEPGRAMGEIAARHFGVPLIVHNDLRPRGLFPRDQIRQVKNATSLLIVDDVLNRGTRLVTYNQSLRENFGNLKVIDFLVGVARPQSSGEWKGHLVAITKKSHLGCDARQRRNHLPTTVGSNSLSLVQRV
jgi:hypothetical protein